MFEAIESRHGKAARLALLAVSTILASTSWQSAALAQAVAGEDQDGAISSPANAEIVVTGTSIRGVAPVGAIVTVLDSDALSATGLANMNDIIKQLPQVIDIGYGEGRGGGVGAAQGNITQAKTINLRGLGIESTLVLLNGRRIPPAGSLGAGYDTGIFATNAIQRLEVIADGASAIYGSDAVGGVVNFITKRNYTGMETSLRYGFGKGFDEKQIGQTLGYSWGSGSIFIAGEHYQRSGLRGDARAEVTQDLRPYGGPDLRSNFASPGNIRVDGVSYAIPKGQDGTSLTMGDLIAGTENREDINPFRSLLVDQNQERVYGTVVQEITPSLEVWAEGFWSNRKYTGLGTSLNRGAGTAALVVPNTNPFFVHPTNPAATSVSINYSFSDAFPFTARGGEEGWQAAAGFSFNPFADWVLDAFATYSGNLGFRQTDQVLSANLAEVLADPDPTTAFNPFCDASMFECNSAATIDKLRGYNIIEGRYRATDFVAKFAGTVAELPGGPLSVAVGGEYFKPKLRTSLTFLTTTTSPTKRVTFSNRNVKSAFGEVVVPVFGPANAVPGFEELEFTAALRFEDYSDFGSTTNPKFGVNWTPTEGFTLRGSYGTSFRAPTLADIDFGSSATYSAVNVFDPSLGRNIRALQLVGPRVGLGPETATTFAVGVDLAPPAVPGLRASLTYYNIKYKDRIQSISVSTILNDQDTYADYIDKNPSLDALTDLMNSIYFRDVQEDPANFDVILDARRANLGAVKQDGIDFSLNYDWYMLDLNWRAGFNATKIFGAAQSTAETLPFDDVLDKINHPISFRARGNVGFETDTFRFDAFMNHVGSYTNDLITPAEKVDSWTTVDLSASYSFPETSSLLSGLSVGVSVNNAFNADPPFVLNVTGSQEGLFDPQGASVIGRFFAIDVKKKW